MLRKIRYKLVYNRARRLNKRGEGLIEIECTQQKRRIYFTTHTYVKPENFVELPIGELFGGKMAELIAKYSGNAERVTKVLGSNAAVNKVLRQLLNTVGADSKITFHSSRHTFATLLGQSGVQLTTIQKLLGHQKLQTTQIYSEVDRKAITNDLKKGRKRKNKSDE